MLPEVPLWMPAFFVLLALFLSLTFPWALYRSTPESETSPLKEATALALGWLAFTGLAAFSGKLQNFEKLPPPMALLLAGMVIGSLCLVGSPWGKQLAQNCSFAGLVGLQAFRFPLELMMHQAAEYGLMPQQMSYSGRNFDIVTGISALFLAAALLKKPNLPRALIWLWNVLGLILLLNVVTVAVLSFPLPFRVFTNEPANIWVTYFPYVWLPCIMVSAALIGHLLIFRKLLRS